MDDAKPLVFNLGPLDSISAGHGRSYIVCGEEIAVFRQRDGRVFAVNNRCPHRGGLLADGLAGNGKVVCPLHAHRFDLATGAGAEKGECIKTYPVRVESGEMFIRVPNAAL